MGRVGGRTVPFSLCGNAGKRECGKARQPEGRKAGRPIRRQFRVSSFESARGRRPERAAILLSGPSAGSLSSIFEFIIILPVQGSKLGRSEGQRPEGRSGIGFRFLVSGIKLKTKKREGRKAKRGQSHRPHRHSGTVPLFAFRPSGLPAVPLSCRPADRPTGFMPDRLKAEPNPASCFSTVPQEHVSMPLGRAALPGDFPPSG